MKEKSGGINILIPLTLVTFLGGLLFVFREKVLGIFNPISVVSSVTSANLKETDGRINVLILGSDKRNTGVITSELTDTLLVASIGKVDKDVVLISIPRDLWVRWTDIEGKERYNKINAIYPSYGGGSEPLLRTVEEVLGMPIHYYSLVTFDLFRDVINILDGIDVDVETSFTDYSYPVEGMENAPIESDRYKTVSFEKGPQKMDGETALQFVRSRKGTNGEGTDFARAKRQQKVIEAIKNKVFNTTTLLNPAKIKDMYDAYSKNVDTNLDFSAVQGFYILSQQISFNKVISVVLDDRSEADSGGLLYAPEDTTLYSNQYVLLPKTGDYSQIHAFVQKYLFGNK